MVAYERGVSDTVDPLAGSYYVEALTSEIEQQAWQLIAQIDAIGGSVIAIEQGFIQDEIARSAYRYQQQVETGEKIIVGVNRFQSEESSNPPSFKIDDSIRLLQIEKIRQLRKQRNPGKCDAILQDLNDKASSGENIMPVVIEAVENKCTLGEIADTLREVFGEYRG